MSGSPAKTPVAELQTQVLLRPATFLFALLALVVQLVPAWRAGLLYDRPALAAGELWRLWTGHLVHFGWPHFLVDAGLLLIVGWFAESRHPAFTRLGLWLMPAFVSGCLYAFEPAMLRYGGLSALNLGLLVYVAAQGWRRDWTDWFWPAVLLAYVAELFFEHYRGGTGGGTIRFDDPGIRVATGAHLASAAYALLALGASRLRPRRTL
ncbi:Rhomboid family protein [Lacunisphaera limnophila]|uniref:Rhomboid family protein n=1 Tax=Lacunisphaera limnophila TaxID=1838286 RepID=A0A1D8AZ24_9BACT|nr:rhombosortase [Lacunisphaera limnophila]AOS46152.1 Rhomboid family protein [Lacunisphaera limnophila]